MFSENFSGPLQLAGEEPEVKKTRHGEERIAFALKQAETGTSVATRGCRGQRDVVDGPFDKLGRAFVSDSLFGR